MNMGRQEGPQQNPNLPDRPRGTGGPANDAPIEVTFRDNAVYIGANLVAGGVVSSGNAPDVTFTVGDIVTSNGSPVGVVTDRVASGSSNERLNDRLNSPRGQEGPVGVGPVSGNAIAERFVVAPGSLSIGDPGPAASLIVGIGTASEPPREYRPGLALSAVPFNYQNAARMEPVPTRRGVKFYTDTSTEPVAGFDDAGRAWVSADADEDDLRALLALLLEGWPGPKGLPPISTHPPATRTRFDIAKGVQE